MISNRDEKAGAVFHKMSLVKDKVLSQKMFSKKKCPDLVPFYSVSGLCTPALFKQVKVAANFGWRLKRQVLCEEAVSKIKYTHYIQIYR